MNEHIGKVYDYAFIGSGPAALVAAHILASDPQKEIILIEAGPSVDQRRTCPGLKSYSCHTCLDTRCPVTMGVGGASATFGNKLCHFPASKGILELIPDSIQGALYAELGQIVGRDPLGSAGLNNIVPLDGLSTRKFYDARRLFRSEYMELIASLVRRLPSNVVIKSNTFIQNVRKDAAGVFVAEASTGPKIRTTNLAVATGRAGAAHSAAWFRALDVPFKSIAPDIGFRLEAKTDAFNTDYFYQLDPKFKFSHGSIGSSRTFCSCADGTIVPVKLGDAFYADGAFVNGPTGRSNAALMVRASDTLEVEELEKWCRSINRASNGSLLMATLESTSFSRLAAEIHQRIPEWPTQNHAQLMRELLTNVIAGRPVQMFKPGAQVRVFGPSVDRFWPQPEINANFYTRVKGVSVLGDATGLSRGIVQALASGLAWGTVESSSATLSAPDLRAVSR